MLLKTEWVGECDAGTGDADHELVMLAQAIQEELLFLAMAERGIAKNNHPS